MRPKVYLETTIVSYLAAEPSRDLVVAAHQALTREWWQQRCRFDVFVSQAVLREAGGGDGDAARRRLEVLAGIPVLAGGSAATNLAQLLVQLGAVPPQHAIDALHIALAVTSGMDYLLTWNCSHIANASIRHKIDRVCIQSGFGPSVLCTPEELLEE
jgi:hypothetical protein